MTWKKYCKAIFIWYKYGSLPGGIRELYLFFFLKVVLIFTFFYLLWCVQLEVMSIASNISSFNHQVGAISYLQLFNKLLLTSIL